MKSQPNSDRARMIGPSSRSGARPSRPGPDRLTQLLIWIALILTAAAAALGADLLSGASSAGLAAQGATARTPPWASQAPPTETMALPEMPSPTSSPTMAPATAGPTPDESSSDAGNGHDLTPAAAITPPACVPPDDWGLYVVQEGNTLDAIARRFGTDVDALMRVNCLNTTTIFVEQRLYVPGPSPTLVVPTAVADGLPVPVQTQESANPAGSGGTPSLVEGTAAVAVGTPLPAPTVQGAFRLNMPADYLNIVLLGSDKRPKSGAWRTDSMIVVSVDMQRSVVRLLSIPRDLWVFIPGHGYNRINTADLWGELAKKGGGPERVKQTIHYNLGIPIHYYVRVDFQGFIKIIDTVGGVDIDVDCPLPDINLSAGVHHMNGAQALRFSRSRKSTNDFDRGRRQRKVLMALWDQALSLDIIPKLPSLWRTMADTFQTDLPLDQVINLAYVGVNLKPQRILSRAIGPALVKSWVTPAGASVLLPQPDKIGPYLEAYYAPLDPTGLDVTSKVRVEVVNGWTRNDAEQLAAAALRWAGYQVTSTSVAERRDRAQSQVIALSGNREAAEQVAALLKLPAAAVQVMQEPTSQARTADIQILLGRDYDPCGR